MKGYTMNNILAAIIMSYGFISVAIAISFVPQPITKGHKERAARTIIITLWPVAVLGALKLMFEDIDQKNMNPPT